MPFTTRKIYAQGPCKNCGAPTVSYRPIVHPLYCMKKECRSAKFREKALKAYHSKRTLSNKEKTKQTMPALIVGDPMKVLAGRLLEESVLMYREGNEMQKLECMTFFEGEWFEALAHFVGVHPDFIRKHLEAGAKLPDALKPVEVQEGW